MKNFLKNQFRNVFLLVFVATGFIACEKEDGVLESNQKVAITALPSFGNMTIEEAQQLLENQKEGEVAVDFESLTTASKSTSKNDKFVKYSFEALVDKGSATGAQLKARLTVQKVIDWPALDIFRGILVTEDGTESIVNIIFYESGHVYLISVVKGLGVVNGAGTIGSDGTIEGPFHLVINGELNSGNWKAIPDVPLTPKPSIVEIAVATPELSTLVGALSGADLVSALQGDGPFTVFAPTNDAFAALEAIPSGEALKEVLLYHVASGAFNTAALLEKKTVTTLQGEDVTIEMKDGVVLLNGAVKVAIANIEASNGIVHVISDVLLISKKPALKSIVEIAVETPAFSTLVGALQAADLVTALQGDGPFTVFAPTNDAFEKLAAVPSGDALKEVLLYHVAAGAFDAATLLRKKTVTTLQGQDVTIEKRGDKVFLNGTIEVATADVTASNGIIHVITDVLIPPTTEQSIVAIAAADPDLSALVGFLQQTGLDETLQGNGPFTVFAPINKIAKNLGLFGTGVQEILLDHVVSGKFDVATLVNKGSITNVAGNKITFSTNQNGDIIINNGIKIILENIQASNGIIHKIRGVIL